MDKATVCLVARTFLVALFSIIWIDTLSAAIYREKTNRTV